MSFLLEIIFGPIINWIIERYPEETLSWLKKLFILVIVSGILGYSSGLILKHRIFPKLFFEGISLILSPILFGITMKLYGNWTERKGYKPSVLSTFWGGFIFALVFTGMRLLAL